MFVELIDRKGDFVDVSISKISVVKYVKDDYKNDVAMVKVGSDMVILSCPDQIAKLESALTYK